MTNNDPRGPMRKWVSIEQQSIETLVTFECGHIGHFNPIFDYSLDPQHHCFQCAMNNREKQRELEIEIGHSDLSDKAIINQREEELIEIDENGVVHGLGDTRDTLKSTVLRDPEGSAFIRPPRSRGSEWEAL